MSDSINSNLLHTFDETFSMKTITHPNFYFHIHNNRDYQNLKNAKKYAYKLIKITHKLPIASSLEYLEKYKSYLDIVNSFFFVLISHIINDNTINLLHEAENIISSKKSKLAHKLNQKHIGDKVAKKIKKLDAKKLNLF